ncbi:calmodulin-like [Symsagittifera roscoffensis]|uniref:calmodulin-like n=1 Tax=Symsagittifera roscoffensis TaxID=84072 RepID=UPI00307C1FE6
MSSMSDDTIAELREVFEHFDQNKDGQLTACELKAVMEKAIGEDITLEYAEHLIQQASNGNQFCDFEHFLAFMKKKMHPEITDQDLEDAFKEFDHDGDRVITRDELKVAMKNLGEVLSDEDIDSIMKEADHDGNGTIDFDEFKKIVLGH